MLVPLCAMFNSAIEDGHYTSVNPALRVLRKTRTEKQEGHAPPRMGDAPAWIFISEEGNPLNPDNFRHRVWAKLLSKAGMRQIRIHDLRHSYASLLIAQGESLAYVKEQMGHHSIQVTVDTYGHLVPGGDKAAVDRLNDSTDATERNPGAISSDAEPAERTKKASK
jgi:integrase